MRVKGIAVLVALGLTGPGMAWAEAATPTAPEAGIVRPAISVSTVGKQVLRDRVIAGGMVGAARHASVLMRWSSCSADNFRAAAGAAPT